VKFTRREEKARVAHRGKAENSVRSVQERGDMQCPGMVSIAGTRELAQNLSAQVVGWGTHGVAWRLRLLPGAEPVKAS